MKKFTFVIVTLVYLLILCAGCTKDGGINVPPIPVHNPPPPPPKPVCDLATISSSSAGNTVNIGLSFNNDRQLSVIRQTGTTSFTKVLNYSGNTIIANSTGSSTQTDSVVLNANGLIAFSQSKTFTGATVTRKSVNKFTYDNNNQLTKSTSQINDGAITTTNYTFTNGDLTSSTGGDVATYTYYTDREFADGDFLKLFQLLNHSGLFVKNRHLVKSVQRGSTMQNFIYEFDADGKITRLTGTTGSTVEVLNFLYKCK